MYFLDKSSSFNFLQLSLEPCEAREKKERLGLIEEKGQQWRFYCIARLVNTCQSVNTNNLKGITATLTFVEHGEQTQVENCTPVTKWKC